MRITKYDLKFATKGGFYLFWVPV